VTSTVHAAPVVLTMTGEPLRDAAVLVVDGVVEAVGPRSDLPGHRIRDWPGVMTPGLVNAHAHLEHGPPFAHLAAAGLPRDQWSAAVEAVRQGLSEADWQVAARGSAHQAIRSGTTAVADVPRGAPVATSLGLQGIAPRESVVLHCGLADERRGPTAVVVCVRSNAVLGFGDPRVAELLATGELAIGTDSLASCPDLDLLAEARAVRDLARRQGLDDPEEAIVTALTGTIEPGRRADLAVFDVPTKEPFRDLVEHGAGRCVATVIGGRLVHRR
jgi:cytosine/adenosine deaminase-related metal-dependent hydrolase